MLLLNNNYALSSYKMQTEFEEERQTAQLSWERKDVEVPEGMDEVEYSVLAYCDGKEDSKKVYR